MARRGTVPGGRAPGGGSKRRADDGAGDGGSDGDAAQRLRQAALLLRERRPLAALEQLDAAASRAGTTAQPAWRLLRGVAETRLGRLDTGCAVLLPLLDGAEPWASEAASALADAHHLAQRHDDLRGLLNRGSAWAASPRGALFAARLHAPGDPERALAGLLSLLDTPPAGELQRIAGFDAVKLLDRLGRYRTAFELATRLHAAAPAFDLDDFLGGARLQHRLLASKGAAWCRPAGEPAGGTAFVVGLPRTGTTLLEQMLDCHPQVAGIGEFEGVGQLAEALIDGGAWPYRLNHLAASDAARIGGDYRRRARRQARAGALWTLDKSLASWRWLPALAAVLPGAVGLHVLREPRDMAISAHLSYFDALQFGWTARLDAIRCVIEAERALVPLALQTLAMPHETVVYETLVADPRATLQRCLGRLDLTMDDRVLAPERSTRTALTLSHDQVRRPVNDASIGRWRHYDWAFDARWEALAAASPLPASRPG